MSSETSAATTSPILYLAIGVVFGAAVVRTSWFAASANNILRDVSVSYMYETNPGEASGSTDRAVDSIQFYPGYVVITGPSGHGNLFAVDRLRKFAFAPTRTK